MANETIRRLCDGEEIVLAEESIPPALNPPHDPDPRSGTLERRHRATAGRSEEQWADARQHGKLKSNVRSVEEKAGRPLETQVESAVEGDASPGA